MSAQGRRARPALGAAVALAFGALACGTDTVIAVSTATVPDVTPTTPARTPAATAPGYLHTKGGRLFDDQEREVRLVAISWFGLETNVYAPHGLWTRSMASMLDQIRSLGFVAIRVPFSNQLLDGGDTPNVDTNANPDLKGLSGLEILDKLVDGAKLRGLKIILDRHQASAEGKLGEQLWYTDQYPETRWIADFEQLATRYRDDPTVVGFELATDLRDPATWGDGNQATDFRAAAERAGNAILRINSNVLVIVEGVQTAGGTTYWRGGNLSAVATAPIHLDVSGRLVYATQDYPSTVEDQPWFHDSTYPANLPSLWDARWGHLVTDGLAPVFVAGFGTKYTDARDRQWLGTLVNYLADRNLSFSYWCLNPDSDGTGGILADDWETVNAGVYGALAPIVSSSVAR